MEAPELVNTRTARTAARASPANTVLREFPIYNLPPPSNMCSPEYQLMIRSGAGVTSLLDGGGSALQDLRSRDGGEPIQITTSAPERNIGPQVSCKAGSTELAAVRELTKTNTVVSTNKMASARAPKT